jgi:hypothetical protein
VNPLIERNSNEPVRAQPREVLCHRGIPLHSKEEMKTAREAARAV